MIVLLEALREVTFKLITPTCRSESVLRGYGSRTEPWVCARDRIGGVPCKPLQIPWRRTVGGGRGVIQASPWQYLQEGRYLLLLAVVDLNYDGFLFFKLWIVILGCSCSVKVPAVVTRFMDAT